MSLNVVQIACEVAKQKTELKGITKSVFKYKSRLLSRNKCFFVRFLRTVDNINF